MKFCPYCGASLVGGAASFCSECGSKVPAKEPSAAPPPKQVKRTAAPPKRKRAPSQASGPRPKRKKNPMDINYDGYYDDVQPVDAGRQGERMDPEMIKKIILLLAGVILVIVLATVFMTLL